jgi:hypothetical protein
MGFYPAGISFVMGGTVHFEELLFRFHRRKFKREKIFWDEIKKKKFR